MKSYISQQLGKRIQCLRKIKGYSQESFAEKIGIATNTLSSIETGNAFMTAQTMEKIIEILNITPAELFSFSETVNSNDIYTYILEKLDFLKNDKDRLKVVYNVIKSLLE